MRGLEPGGLALVIKFPWSPGQDVRKHIGKAVTTVALMYPGENRMGEDGFIISNTSRAPIWYCTGDIQQEMLSGRFTQGYAVLRPAFLLPINGEDDEFTDSGRMVVVREMQSPPCGMLPLP